MQHKELVEKFLQKAFLYSQEDQAKIRAAAEFADELHGDQKRKSGEPYIIHPLAVAEILIQLRMDRDTICAGLLHDTVEDTQCTLQDVEELFGHEVAVMVDGVTKISRLKNESKSLQEAKTIRKMFFAMGNDMRVIIIKLSDKLHNMRTLQYMNPERQKEIAQDCLDIFAPLAGTLGISSIKSELEDLSLKILKPDAYNYINDFLLQKRGEYNAYIKNIKNTITEACKKVNINNIEIKGRVKHVYSIYQKIKKRKKEIDEIFDVLGIRVICNDVTECYTILGIIHQTWHPIEGRFKDYIAMPKSNNYQSLHTTVLGPNSRHLEIQIRTREMDKTAEEGIAAHWSYKASSGSENAWKNYDSENFNKIIKKIKNWSNEISENDDYMDEIKNELLKDSIVVFTPKGRVIELPVGATALDFAFKIHSEVGTHCTGAKADGSIIALSKPLQNTQTVEILTSPNAHPNDSWLNMVMTSGARKKIMNWLNKNQPANAPQIQEKKKKEEQQPEQAKQSNTVLMQGVKFIPTGKNPSTVIIGNDKHILFDFAKCCNPVHGDDIVAYITRGRGYVIHKRDCPNLKHMNEVDQRLVPVEWDSSELVRRFKVMAKANTDLFAEIDGAVKKCGGRILAGMLDASYSDVAGTFTISAPSEATLQNMISSIRQLPTITKIWGV
ncbi:MAG: RelA/SpoT family protein [Sphaerochaetaceae bacterium]|nr:RelA/SpoT family protein [Sphaerochaetaceae bacterium]